VEFQCEFTLVARVDGQLTAVVGYFDVEFQSVSHKKSFTTSPHDIPTHWKQTVFLLHTPVSVIAGKTHIFQYTCLDILLVFILVYYASPIIRDKGIMFSGLALSVHPLSVH